MLGKEFIKYKMNNFLNTLLGILIWTVLIIAMVSISNERHRETSCPEADCYIEIYP